MEINHALVLKKNTFVHYQLDLKLNLTDMDTENKSAETWAINMYSRSSTDFQSLKITLQHI